jgi:hypothetical protein
MGKSEFENLLEMGFCYFQFSSLQKTSATAVDSRPDSEFPNTQTGTQRQSTRQHGL